MAVIPPRVWDTYLTPSDRARVAAQPVVPRGGGVRPAVVFVDLYRAAFGDRPQALLDAIEDWPSSCGMAGWAALPSIERLLAEGRALGLPIVHVTALESAPRWSPGSPRAAGPRPGQEDRWQRRYDIIDELRPLPGEVVVKKSSPSAFHGTALVDYLVGFGVDTVVVAGESTSGCVRATVVDGRSHRFRMIVPEECVFDRDEAPHAINLFDMHEKYADVQTLDEVLGYLRTTVSPAGTA